MRNKPTASSFDLWRHRFKHMVAVSACVQLTAAPWLN